ncbi:MAG: hypothetical protein M1114_00235 [Candidatus Dependentiae bacterium]|nr:hypothetical protein [Candidatus Dependentiae bacterium]
MFKRLYFILFAMLLLTSGIYSSESAVARRGQNNWFTDKAKAGLVIGGGLVCLGLVVKHYLHDRYTLKNGWIHMPKKGDNVFFNNKTEKFAKMWALSNKNLDYITPTFRHYQFEEGHIDLGNGYIGRRNQNGVAQVCDLNDGEWHLMNIGSPLSSEFNRLEENNKPGLLQWLLQLTRQKMSRFGAWVTKKSVNQSREIIDDGENEDTMVVNLGDTKAWKKKNDQTWHIDGSSKKVEEITYSTEGGHQIQCIKIDGIVYAEDENIWYKLVRGNDGRLRWETL